jgi:hypothetical protein
MKQVRCLLEPMQVTTVYSWHRRRIEIGVEKMKNLNKDEKPDVSSKGKCS